MSFGAVNAADGFALAMVAILMLSMGVVGLLLFSICRNAKKRKSEVDELLEEMSDEEKAGKHPAAPTGSEPREPWERDEDWWKK